MGPNSRNYVWKRTGQEPWPGGGVDSVAVEARQGCLLHCCAVRLGRRCQLCCCRRSPCHRARAPDCLCHDAWRDGPSPHACLHEAQEVNHHHHPTHSSESVIIYQSPSTTHPSIVTIHPSIH